MLYEIVAGVKPFGAPDVSGILRNVVELDPKKANQINAAIPESLAQFIHKLIAKSPDERFASAGDALEELKKIRAEVASAGPGEVEELSRSDALGTLAGLPNTSIAHEDLTPAITPRSSSILTRRIPRPLAASVLAAVLAGLAVTAIAIRASTPGERDDLIPAQKLKEFEYKELAMNSARAMYIDGKYQDAINAYDEYLKRYPWATAAQAERAEAQSALNESKSAKARVDVTAKRPKPPVKKEEPKKGFFRRIFGRS
jgi:tetratricopeptide (TPR) repeat protein